LARWLVGSGPSGLYTMGDRTYDPTLARFTQPDPKSQGPDPYAYAGDNPVNNTDPTGEGILSEPPGGDSE
jgi:RHS repeat-associated protein